MATHLRSNLDELEKQFAHVSIQAPDDDELELTAEELLPSLQDALTAHTLFALVEELHRLGIPQVCALTGPVLEG